MKHRHHKLKSTEILKRLVDTSIASMAKQPDKFFFRLGFHESYLPMLKAYALERGYTVISVRTHPYSAGNVKVDFASVPRFKKIVKMVLQAAMVESDNMLDSGSIRETVRKQIDAALDALDSRALKPISFVEELKPEPPPAA